MTDGPGSRSAFGAACRLAAAGLVGGAMFLLAAGAGPSVEAGMVRVPPGAFFMGCAADVDTQCEPDEPAGRLVRVGAFAIDRREVTVADYRRCVAAGVCSSEHLKRPSRTDFTPYCNWEVPGRDRHPINCVDWSEAAAYCAWVGKRLPTGIEWERAARGTDRRLYPWGNAADALGGRRANLHQGGVPAPDAYPDTAPVGSFPDGAAPTGALDMCGNVQEWTADADGDGRGIRGGSWLSQPRHARVSFRAWFPMQYRDGVIGFRCAR